MRYLLSLFLVFMVTTASAEYYDTTIVKTTLKRQTEDRVVAVQNGTVLDEESGKQVPVYIDEVQTFNIDDAPLVLDVPFRVYGYNIVSNGKDITYDLHNMALDGVEVVARVDYRIKEHRHNSRIKSERTQAEAFKGNIGKEWKVIKEDAVVKKHWTRTKADSLATYDKDGVKTEYDGIDKSELVQFAQWEGAVKVIKIEEADIPILEVIK